MTEQIYTVPQVAKKLKLHAITAYRLVKRGKIVASRIGRSIRISEAQFQETLRKGDLSK